MKHLSHIVESQINLLTQPNGPDDDHTRAELTEEAQGYANSRNKPVRVLLHNGTWFEVRPAGQARKVKTSALAPGDVIQHEGRPSETVIGVTTEPLPCVVATVVTSAGWFYSGIDAVHAVI